MTKKVTIVVDGDWLAFLAACMVHPLHYIATYQDEEVLIHTSSSTFDKKLKKLDYPQDELVLTKERRLIDGWEAQAEAIAVAKANKLRKLAGATSILIAIGGDTNFRTELNLLYSCYKDRADSYRPPVLREVRGIVKRVFDYVESNYEEADDLISRYQYLGRKDGSYIVVTEDKDAKQTPGYVLNPRSLEIKDCSGFGEIQLEKKSRVNSKGVTVNSYKLHGQGRIWFYYQLVCGDPVDTYHPFPKNITDKMFYEMFEDVKTDAEAWTKVVELYKKYHGDVQEYERWDGKIIKGTWIDILQTYIDVVHMRRWDGDRIDARQVLKLYGLLEEETPND